MRTRRAAVVLFGLGALFTLGCKGITTPSNNQSVTFSGTLQPRGSNSHAFSVSKSGEFSARLTAWAPNTNLFVGIWWTIGNSDGSCTSSALQANNFATLNTQALGGAIVSGRYCVIILDAGATLTAPQTYTIVVSHP